MQFAPGVDSNDELRARPTGTGLQRVRAPDARRDQPRLARPTGERPADGQRVVACRRCLPRPRGPIDTRHQGVRSAAMARRSHRWPDVRPPDGSRHRASHRPSRRRRSATVAQSMDVRRRPGDAGELASAHPVRRHVVDRHIYRRRRRACLLDRLSPRPVAVAVPAARQRTAPTPEDWSAAPSLCIGAGTSASARMAACTRSMGWRRHRCSGWSSEGVRRRALDRARRDRSSPGARATARFLGVVKRRAARPAA